MQIMKDGFDSEKSLRIVFPEDETQYVCALVRRANRSALVVLE